jgi:hypothetical protein
LIRDPVHRARYAFEPDGDNVFVDTWLEPGGALPPHLHPRQEERWSVLEGEVRFQLGKDKRVLRPEDGEVIVAPGTVHALDSAAAAREGLFMKGGIPKSLRGARWAARFLKQHRDDVVMSFPPRFVQSALIGLLGR